MAKAFKNLQMMKKDVLLKPTDTNHIRRLNGSLIAIHGTDRLSAENDTRYYEVLATGPQCKNVVSGDIVFMKWVDTIPTFDWNGEKLTLTSEERVLGVCDLQNT